LQRVGEKALGKSGWAESIDCIASQVGRASCDASNRTRCDAAFTAQDAA
jgi:hypothetical protein